MQIWPRAIALIDMNAFFASIEQLDHPELRSRPIGITNGRTGTCLITCSYEARQYGIRTGMRLPEARKLCPEVIQIPARPERYVQVSTRIMQAMLDFTPDVEVFSVDEAFLDLTRCQQLGHPVDIARRVKERVREVAGILCSVGLSGDKTTAKYAAKLQKPDGFTVIPPWESRNALRHVPLTELCGIKRGIGGFLADRGVHVCGDMEKLPIGVLAKRFGNLGRRIWYMAQGMDPVGIERKAPPPKTIGHGKVMPPNTRDLDVIRIYFRHMSEKVAERLRQHTFEAQHFFVGLLTEQGWMASTQLKTAMPTSNGRDIMQLCETLLSDYWRGHGVFQCQVTALDPKQCGNQLEMFAPDTGRQNALNQAIDMINRKFGDLALSPAPLLKRSAMPDVIAPAWKPYGHRQTIKPAITIEKCKG